MMASGVVPPAGATTSSVRSPLGRPFEWPSGATSARRRAQIAAIVVSPMLLVEVGKGRWEGAAGRSGAPRDPAGEPAAGRPAEAAPGADEGGGAGGGAGGRHRGGDHPVAGLQPADDLG